MHFRDIKVTYGIAELRTVSKFHRERRTYETPTVFLYMVEITGVARESVSMTGSVDASPTELLRFLVSKVPTVTLIEDAVGKGAPRSD